MTGSRLTTMMGLTAAGLIFMTAGCQKISRMLPSSENRAISAYLEYRTALLEDNREVLVRLLSEKHSEALKGDQADVILEQIRSLSPRNVTVTGSEADLDEMILHVKGDTGPGFMKGRVTMVAENGTWKVAEENWDLKTYPHPFKFRRGKKITKTSPVDPEFLELPMRPAVSTAPFYKPGNPPKPLQIMRGHEEEVTRVLFTPDGRYILSIGYGDYSIRVWDASTGESTHTVKLPDRPTDLRMTPDGQTAVTGDVYGRILLHPFQAGLLGNPITIDAAAGQNMLLDISPNGRLLATGSFNCLLTIWDLSTRTQLCSLKTPEPLREVCFSPCGTVLAAGTDSCRFILFNLSTGELRSYEIDEVDKKSDVASIHISSDGRFLATGHMDSSITVWDFKKQKELQNFWVSNASTWQVRFSPASDILATAQQNYFVYLWNPLTSDSLATLLKHRGAARCLAFSQDGQKLVSGGEDGLIILWTAGADS